MHEAAQYPNEYKLRGFDDKPDDSEEAQIALFSALTSSAFSLAATSGIVYGWSSFEDALENRTFFNARRK